MSPVFSSSAQSNHRTQFDSAGRDFFLCEIARLSERTEFQTKNKKYTRKKYVQKDFVSLSRAYMCSPATALINELNS